MKCEETIHMTNSYGKAGKRNCGREAVDNIGFPIYQKCLNKIEAKRAIKAMRKQTGLTNAQLRDSGLISNNKKPINR